MAVKSFRQLIGADPSTASTSDSVLIIIDAQNEYADGHLKVENLPSSRSAITNLPEKYRAANGTIVHILHETPAGAPVFTLGKDLSREFPEVVATGDEKVIHKKTPGSFTGTGLNEFLKGTGKEKVVLVGYMAHVCVSTTARQAAELGYDVLLPEDAIGDRNIPGASAEDVVKMVLAELGDAFGTVIKGSSIK